MDTNPSSKRVCGERHESPPSSVADKPRINEFDQIALIRKFQRIEGNFDCCASAYVKVCQQLDCLWRNKCLSAHKINASSLQS